MTLEKITLSLRLESLYSSNMRNSFVLFTLGLTVINLSKNKNKFLFALLLIFGGISLGISSTYEYNKKINLIRTNKLNEYEIKTNNYYIIIYALGLLSLIFIYRFMIMNEKHNFIKRN
jgi:hypothetical protein